MDWNEVGEGFFSNTVTGHLWHLIPGAHYERMYGEGPNPHVYQLLGMCADHYHFDTGAGWTKSRASFDGAPASTSDALGGGHAHCGALVYQGDQWPASWRGKMLTINFHGRRLNVDRLERSGSGYVAKHEPDAFFFGDPWFRGIDLIQAADGGVFVADWSDASECHDNDGVHRTSGRIYKIAYGEGKGAGFAGDVAKRSGADLFQAQFGTDEWLVRHARLASQERAAAGTDLQTDASSARAVLHGKDAAPLLRLRALLALHAANAATLEDYRHALLNRDTTNRDEYVESWAVRLLADRPELAVKAAADLAARAKSNASPLLRLTLASVLPRFPAEVRKGIVDSLLANHPDDAHDAAIASILWNTLKDYAPAELAAVPEHAAGLLARWATRRLAEEPETLGQLGKLLERSSTAEEGSQTLILDGLRDALRGVRKSAKPEHWDTFAAKAARHLKLAAEVRDLAVIFGDGRALDEVRAIALDAKAELPARRQALQSLIEARPPDLRAICEQSLDVRDLAGVAARGLANFDDPKIGTLLIQRYGGLYPQMQPDAIGALASRPAWAAMLLDAIARGQIPRTDLGAYHARQIRSFNDNAITKRLAEVWGDVRETDDAKKALIAKLKAQLTPDLLAKADLAAGRALFTQACAVCHKLYGEGGAFGPDLTGSRARDHLPRRKHRRPERRRARRFPHVHRHAERRARAHRIRRREKRARLHPARPHRHPDRRARRREGDHRLPAIAHARRHPQRIDRNASARSHRLSHDEIPSPTTQHKTMIPASIRPLLLASLFIAPLASADIGLNAKPLPGAEVLLDGTRETLDAKWTYWEGPGFKSAMPIKWKIVEDPVDKGTVVQ